MSPTSAVLPARLCFQRLISREEKLLAFDGFTGGYSGKVMLSKRQIYALKDICCSLRVDRQQLLTWISSAPDQAGRG